jgi:hypothetical protein
MTITKNHTTISNNDRDKNFKLEHTIETKIDKPMTINQLKFSIDKYLSVFNQSNRIFFYLVESPNIKKEEAALYHFNVTYNTIENQQKPFANKYMIIAHDIISHTCSTGTKRYIIATPAEIYNLVHTKLFYFNELLRNDVPVKLFIDIDIDLSKKCIPNDLKNETGFQSVCKEVLQLFVNKLNLGKKFKSEIIILNASSDKKYSAHFIFNNVYFKSINHLIQFIHINEIDKHPLAINTIMDISIYRNNGLFRTIWSKKFKPTTTQLDTPPFEFQNNPYYKYTNDKKLWIDSLITYIPKHATLIEVDMDIVIENKMKNKKHIYINKCIDHDDPNNKIHMNIDHLRRYAELLNYDRINSTYNQWMQICILFKCLNPTKECFELFDEISKKSPKYTSEEDNLYKWNSCTYTKYNIGTLYYMLKIDNPILFSELYNELNPKPYQELIDAVLEPYNDIENENEPNNKRDFNFKPTHIIKENYLLNKDEKLYEPTSVVGKCILDWYFNDSYKTLSIKSTYNTGKTTLISSIISTYTPFRICFITYRQTLAWYLYSQFEVFNVENYLNKDANFSANRIIIQLDSIHKMNYDYEQQKYMHVLNNKVFPTFDLCILDELAGLLMHFESSTLKNKNNTFNLLYYILSNSSKILSLDGDFSDREYDFIQLYDQNPRVIYNTIIKDPLELHFTNNIDNIKSEINDCLADGKNVIVVSMSSNIAHDIYDLFKEKYKSILHTSYTDDSIKQLLIDVYTLWILYKLVIFSPCVESGVSFDEQIINLVNKFNYHFYKMFIILSPNSVSPRGLMQMQSRVRKLTNNNVSVFANNFKYYNDIIPFTFNDIKEYVDSIENDISSKIINVISKDNNIDIAYEKPLYYMTHIHNLLEIYNKKRPYFLKIYIDLMRKKGHKVHISKDILNTKTTTNNFQKNLLHRIANAKDIYNKQFTLFNNNKKNNNCTEEQKYMLVRYFYRKKFNIDMDLSNIYIDVKDKSLEELEEELKKLEEFEKQNQIDVVVNDADIIEAVVNEAVINEAVANEAVVNEAVVNDAVVNEAAVNEAVVNDSKVINKSDIILVGGVREDSELLDIILKKKPGRPKKTTNIPPRLDTPNNPVNQNKVIKPKKVVKATEPVNPEKVITPDKVVKPKKPVNPDKVVKPKKKEITVKPTHITFEFLECWYNKAYIIDNYKLITKQMDDPQPEIINGEPGIVNGEPGIVNGDPGIVNGDPNDIQPDDAHPLVFDESEIFISYIKDLDFNNNKMINIDYRKAIQNEQLKIINDIITKLGFNVNNIGKKHRITKTQFDINITNYFNSTVLLQKPGLYSKLFDKQPGFFNDIIGDDKHRKQLYCINKLLKNYGLKIQYYLNVIKININNNRVSKSQSSYFLSPYKHIDIFI